MLLFFESLFEKVITVIRSKSATSPELFAKQWYDYMAGHAIRENLYNEAVKDARSKVCRLLENFITSTLMPFVSQFRDRIPLPHSEYQFETIVNITEQMYTLQNITMDVVKSGGLLLCCFTFA